MHLKSQRFRSMLVLAVFDFFVPFDILIGRRIDLLLLTAIGIVTFGFCSFMFLLFFVFSILI